jgi:hypothetical protein
VRTIERSEFASGLNVLMNGDEGEVNAVRALQLLADRPPVDSASLYRLLGTTLDLYSGTTQRRRPESNRCERLCRPLRNHSATSPETIQA